MTVTFITQKGQEITVTADTGTLIELAAEHSVEWIDADWVEYDHVSTVTHSPRWRILCTISKDIIE